MKKIYVCFFLIINLSCNNTKPNFDLTKDEFKDSIQSFFKNSISKNGLNWRIDSLSITFTNIFEISEKEAMGFLIKQNINNILEIQSNKVDGKYFFNKQIDSLVKVIEYNNDSLQRILNNSRNYKNYYKYSYKVYLKSINKDDEILNETVESVARKDLSNLKPLSF